MRTIPIARVCWTLLLSGITWQQIPAAGPVDVLAGTPAYAHGRTDNELMATHGSCRLTDIRHFALLTARSWDLLAWRSAGDYYGFGYDGNGNGLWPEYRMLLEIFVDGKKQSVLPATVAHQFDCRNTEGGTAQLQFRRIDMMMATLQWITAWRCRNVTDRTVEVRCRLSLSDDKNLAKTLAASADGHLIFQDRYTSHLAAFDRKPEVEVAGARIAMTWKADVAPGKDCSVCLALRPDWAEAYEDVKRPLREDVGYKYKGSRHDPRVLPKVQQLEFQAAARLLGLPAAGLNWPDIVKISGVKQQRLYAPMPTLAGLPPA